MHKYLAHEGSFTFPFGEPFKTNYLSITGTDQNEDNFGRSNFFNIIDILYAV